MATSSLRLTVLAEAPPATRACAQSHMSSSESDRTSLPLVCTSRLVTAGPYRLSVLAARLGPCTSRQRSNSLCMPTPPPREEREGGAAALTGGGTNGGNRDAFSSGE